MKKRKECGAIDRQVGGKKSAGSPGRPPEVQKEQRPGGSSDPRRAAREEREQTQREW